MGVEKFIKYVFEHKCLWDSNEPSYHLRDVQKRAWRSISKDMNISVDELKKKWRGLRDTFGKELRKHQNSQLTGSNWVYFKPLLFLQNSISRRDNRNSLANACHISYGEESMTNTNFPIQTSEINENSFEETKYSLKILPDDESESSNEECSTIQNMQSSNQNSEVNGEIPKRKTPLKKVKRWQPNNTDLRFLEIEEEKLKCFLRCANDPDAQFLMSLLPFLNDIPKDRKLMVRAKLQQVLIDEQNSMEG